jgi:hypothetical protein
MTREQKLAELRIKNTDRCTIAPYAVRIAIFDRLIAATASDMKSNPSRRNLDTDNKIAFKALVAKCR